MPRQPGGLRPASQPGFAPADPPAPRFPGGPPAGRPTWPKSPAGRPQARRPEPSRASDRFSVISRHRRGRRAARTTARDALRRLRARKEPGLYAAKEQPIRLRGVARREVVVEALRRRRARAAAVLVRGGVLARELRVRDAAAVHEHDVEGLGELREGVERVAELRRALHVGGARRRVRPGRGARSADEHRRRPSRRRALRHEPTADDVAGAHLRHPVDAARQRQPGPARARAPRSLAATWARCVVPMRGATSRRRAAASAPRREAPKRKITRVYAPWRLRGQRIHVKIHAAIVSAQHLKIWADTLQVEPSRTSPCDGMRQTAAANAKRRAIARAQRGSCARRKARCTAAAEKFEFAFLFLNSAPTTRLWRPHAATTS